MKLLTTTHVAQALGVTPGRIRQICGASPGIGIKVGRDWMFTPKDVRILKKLRRNS